MNLNKLERETFGPFDAQKLLLAKNSFIVTTDALNNIKPQL
jgi:hypothetical protein